MNRKNLLITTTLIILIICIACNSVNDHLQNELKIIPDSLKIRGFKLVWNDEFNVQGTPDTSKWVYDIGASGWGNNELQDYTSNSENVRVSNGQLIIQAHKTNDSNNYTSARIKTKGKGDWLNGRVEVKAKVPKGKGTWSAIWMLPTNNEYGGWPSSGEIDIMEHVGYAPNVIHGTVHTESFNHTIGTQVGGELNIPNAINDFYIYAIEWDKNKIDFYIDKNKYFTFTNQNKSYREWPFDKKFHLILNIAIGGSWGGVKGIDTTAFPAQMIVDYVRVYEKSKKD